MTNEFLSIFQLSTEALSLNNILAIQLYSYVVMILEIQTKIIK